MDYLVDIVHFGDDTEILSILSLNGFDNRYWHSSAFDDAEFDDPFDDQEALEFHRSSANYKEAWLGPGQVTALAFLSNHVYASIKLVWNFERDSNLYVPGGFDVDGGCNGFACLGSTPLLAMRGTGGQGWTLDAHGLLSFGQGWMVGDVADGSWIAGSDWTKCSQGYVLSETCFKCSSFYIFVVEECTSRSEARDGVMYTFWMLSV
jgi:hypothetical protein